MGFHCLIPHPPLFANKKKTKKIHNVNITLWDLHVEFVLNGWLGLKRGTFQGPKDKSPDLGQWADTVW